MAMKTRLVIPPDEEPVSLAEIKAQLAFTADLGTADDEMLERKLRAARQYVERFIGAPLLAATYDGFLDSFPRAEIEVPFPLRSVGEVAYTDPQGLERIVSAAAYETDTLGETGWIVPIAGARWPETMTTINAVRIRFVAGLAAEAEDVPEPLRDAILQLAAWWYEQRETSAEVAFRQAPYGTDDILREYRRWSF